MYCSACLAWPRTVLIFCVFTDMCWLQGLFGLGCSSAPTVVRWQELQAVIDEKLKLPQLQVSSSAA